MSHLMNILRQRRAALGLEWWALKKLPMVVLGGTLVPLFVSILGRAFAPEGTAAQIGKHITNVDIMAASIMLTVWMAALTVAIACIMVLMMKGPVSTAGAYYLWESDRPISGGDRRAVGPAARADDRD